MRWGGYFMVDGRIYSYLTWPSPPDAQFGAIAEINDDLTPTGNAGLQQPVEGLRRIIPLNFFNTTCLAGAIAGGDLAITVADIDQLPATGYVKIENEVLAYEQKNGATNQLILSEPFRRGCYGTTAAAHPAVGMGDGGMIVRHLPVRHRDGARHVGYPHDLLGRPARQPDVHAELPPALRRRPERRLVALQGAARGRAESDRPGAHRR
jgi:hypothetical protein